MIRTCSRGWCLPALLVIPLSVACGKIEPAPESASRSTMQVTVDSLNVAIRDAQRTATELRGELDEQRKALADAQVARAELQGMLRETERRLTDARQIIELQREELAMARLERERVAQTARVTPGGHRRHTAQAVRPALQGHDAMPAVAVTPREQAEVVPLPTETSTVESVGAPTTESEVGPTPSASEPSPITSAVPSAAEKPHTVVVQQGDTLWGLSRRYRVGVEALRVANGLSGDRIVVGLKLRLPDAQSH